MGELIYSVFEYLSDVPVNFWFWLVPITAPILVFSIGPKKSARLRIGRLLLAIGLTVSFVMLSLGFEYNQSWKDYNECYASHTELRDMSPERNRACRHHLDRVPDSTAPFFLLFGWIPVTGYVGFWELLWHSRYRKEIKALSKNYKGKWFSYIIILTSIPVAGILIYFFAAALYYWWFTKV